MTFFELLKVMDNFIVYILETPITPLFGSLMKSLLQITIFWCTLVIFYPECYRFSNTELKNLVKKQKFKYCTVNREAWKSFLNDVRLHLINFSLQSYLQFYNEIMDTLYVSIERIDKTWLFLGRNLSRRFYSHNFYARGTVKEK